jgi:hypothetical protein
VSSLPSGRRVILVLHGGLGNQLFQFCAGEAIHKRTRCPVFYDCELAFRHDFFGRRFELAHLIPPEQRAPPHPGNGRWRTVCQERFGLVVEKTLIQRRGICSIPLQTMLRMVRWWPRSEVVCRSYFQSLEYLDPESVDRIRSALGLHRSPSTGSEVAVHFRVARDRNSAGNKMRRLFGTVLGMDYYRNALRKVRAELGPVNFRVFSDSQAIPENVFDPGDTVLLDQPHQNETPSDALCRMAGYRHFVIANSTFSWWGPYLCNAAEKRVYAPKTWRFNHWAPGQEGIFPDEWDQV